MSLLEGRRTYRRFDESKKILAAAEFAGTEILRFNHQKRADSYASAAFAFTDDGGDEEREAVSAEIDIPAAEAARLLKAVQMRQFAVMLVAAKDLTQRAFCTGMSEFAQSLCAAGHFNCAAKAG